MIIISHHYYHRYGLSYRSVAVTRIESVPLIKNTAVPQVRVSIFSKNLGATSKFWAPEGWHEAGSILRTKIYRVSQEECARLREGVPYVKVYRYDPKHLCPKLNSYGDNGQRKVWSSGGSTHCTSQLTSLIDVCSWVWCPMTESPLTLAYSRLIPECAISHVTSVLAFMCHV